MGFATYCTGATAGADSRTVIADRKNCLIFGSSSSRSAFVRAAAEGAQGGFGATFGKSAEHDDPQMGKTQPNFMKCFESVHFRHLDIQCEDIGVELGDTLQRDVTVRRRADDLNRRVLFEGMGDEAANHHRIVDNEHPDALAGKQCSLFMRSHCIDIEYRHFGPGQG
jgi:hypothetical protein